MAYITIKNLTFSYKSAGGVSALDDLSFSMEEGEFCLLCGGSASGKTTLLRLLTRLIAPYGEMSGEIFLGRQQITAYDKRELVSAIGFISQNPESQIVCGKPFAQLAFGLENLGYDSNSIRRRVSEMAGYFGIQNYFEKNVNELSGGQKQLLNLASVMVMHPKILLLDEPLAMLDPIYAEEFMNMMRKLNQEMGLTVLMCEHNLEQVSQLADTLCVLDNGRLGYYGTAVEGMKYVWNQQREVIALPPCVSLYLEQEKEWEHIPMTVRDGRSWLSVLHEDSRESILNDHKHTCEKEFDIPGEDLETLVSLKKVCFKYSKYDEFALNHVNFKGSRGEIITLTGGNGAGKSTMLSVISKYYKPLTGKVMTKRVGYLPQDPALVFSEDTVEGELLNVRAAGKSAVSERVGENIKAKMLMQALPGIDRVLSSKTTNPLDLSGGQKQLLAFYKLASADIDVLLLDEPVKGLDAKARNELSVVLKTFAQAGMCILMVTHDLDFAAAVSTRMAMMFQGEIITDDKPSDFFLTNHFYTTGLRRLGQGIIEELY